MPSTTKTETVSKSIHPLIEQAVNIFGSQAKLAKACGVSQASVQKWLHNPQVTPERALKIDQVTNQEVSKEDLRPDVFLRAKNVPEPNELITKAIHIVGTQLKLANALGITRNSVIELLTAPTIPVEVAFNIDNATKGVVSKESLRPDVFG